MRNKTIKKFLSVWVKFSMLSQPVGLLKLMLNLLCSIKFKGRNSVDMII